MGAVRAARPELVVANHLDLGCGTGAALGAARSFWPEIASQVGVERDEEMARIAGRVAPLAHIELCEIASLSGFLGYDLVTCCYSLGELDPPVAEGVVAGALEAGALLLIVEPGTPRGFADIRRWRSLGLSAGGSVVAPCPHDEPCPLGPPDWCHFAARLQRSHLHRQLKGGAAAYEDEKFSYLALSGTRAPSRSDRVLRHPWQAKGRVDLTLCTGSGIEHRTVRRGEPSYRAARKARWGSAL